MTNIVENIKCSKKLTNYEQYFNSNNNNNYSVLNKAKETYQIATARVATTTGKITKRKQLQRQLQRHDLNKIHKYKQTNK